MSPGKGTVVRYLEINLFVFHVLGCSQDKKEYCLSVTSGQARIQDFLGGGGAQI